MTTQTNKPRVRCNLKKRNSSMKMQPEKKNAVAIDEKKYRKTCVLRYKSITEDIFALYFFSYRKGANNIIAIALVCFLV